jgi:hypothetical protein
MRLPRLLRPTTYLGSMSRVAIMTFVWAHRHEVLRWGRSLSDQLITQRQLGPAKLARIGSLLATIAVRDDLRNAPQLRKVTLHGDRVDLDVDERWALLPTLVSRVRGVKGVREIRVNGRVLDAEQGPPPEAIPA